LEIRITDRKEILSYLKNTALESVFGALDQVAPKDREESRMVASVAMGNFLERLGVLTAEKWADAMEDWEDATRV
tara:strand:+ start:1775 stop:1999 length:225 start_codon:yes stop_codon:yes gene_type:complete